MFQIFQFFVLGRGKPGILFKQAVKVADAVKIDAIRNFQNRKVCGLQQVAGKFHLDFGKVRYDRFARIFFKIFQKHGGRIMRHRIDILHGIRQSLRFVELLDELIEPNWILGTHVQVCLIENRQRLRDHLGRDIGDDLLSVAPFFLNEVYLLRVGKKVIQL